MASSGFTPSDVANQALDAMGWPDVLGDLEDGSEHANVLLRAYRECLKQLLRAAMWDFARKYAPLQLLADATGQTQGVGTVVPNPQFRYEYVYPPDCVKARFLPWNPGTPTLPPGSNVTIPDVLLTDNQQPWPPAAGRVMPARFLVAFDYNYPPPSNPIPWDQMGVSPEGRLVILTNVQNASLVYTTLALYPSVWDPLFRAAFVAFLAAECALAIWKKKDPKFGLQMRRENIAILQAKVVEARAQSANEGGPSTSDIRVDWMDARYSVGPGSRFGWGYGGADSAWDSGPGVLGYGWDTLALPGGATF